MKALILTIVTFLFALPALAEHIVVDTFASDAMCAPADQGAVTIVTQWGETSIQNDEMDDGTTRTVWFNEAFGSYTITTLYPDEHLLCVEEIGMGYPLH